MRRKMLVLFLVIAFLLPQQSIAWAATEEAVFELPIEQETEDFNEVGDELPVTDEVESPFDPVSDEEETILDPVTDEEESSLDPVNEEDSSEDSVLEEEQTPTEPIKPTEPIERVPLEPIEGLKARAFGAEFVELTWQEQENIEGYRIYVQRGLEKRQLVAEVTKNQFVDEEASRLFYSFYWVNPYYVDEDGEIVELHSNHYVYAKGLYPHVENLSVDPSISSIKLNWDEVTGASGYHLFVGEDEESLEFYDEVSKTFYLYETKEYEKTFYFSIRPYWEKSDGSIRLGGEANGFASPVEGGLENFSAKVTGLERIFLTWDHIDVADYYIIYRSTLSNNKMQYLYLVPRNQFTDLNAVYDDYNFYRIYPSVRREDGSYIFGKSLSYKYAKPTLNPVKKMEAINDCGYAKVKWDKVNFVEGYRIFRKYGEGDWELIKETNSSTNLIVDENPSFAHYNFYIVTPFGMLKDGIVTVSNKTYDYMKPSMSTVLSKLEVQKDGMKLTWNAVPRAAGYRLYRNNELEGTVHVGDLNNLSYFDKDAKIGYRNYYWVIPYAEEEERQFFAKNSPYTGKFRWIKAEGTGGVHYWLRPDGVRMISGSLAFPEGLPWVSKIAHEVKEWLVNYYRDRYNLQGYIVIEKNGNWYAPAKPLDRSTYHGGYGLDCVGFVNGWTYLYTRALAGEDYKKIEVDMSKTSGVYGTLTLPSGKLGYMPWVVLKPIINGTYADTNHIRPGDFNESTRHAWMVSDQGTGVNSRIWEYSYLHGFDDRYTVGKLTSTPYYEFGNETSGYHLTCAANPMESYATIRVETKNSRGESVSGGVYKIVDSQGRTMKTLGTAPSYSMYRPNGEDYFYRIFNHSGSDTAFYDSSSRVKSVGGRFSVDTVIGSKYKLVEVSPPSGYQKAGDLSFTIAPGETLTLQITYK